MGVKDRSVTQPRAFPTTQTEDGETDRHTDRQTDRQVDRQTDTHTQAGEHTVGYAEPYRLINEPTLCKPFGQTY